MNYEIEYKFKVNKIPKYDYKIEIEQYYLNNEMLEKFKKIIPDADLVRIRRCYQNDYKFFITIKSKGTVKRKEYEKEIDRNTFFKLKKYATTYIKKNRYVIKNKYTFEFDKYLNIDNLMTCEIEVKEQNDDTYREIIDILTKQFNLQITDVTDDYKFKNVNLAQTL